MYSEISALKLRDALGDHSAFVEKKMMGGLIYMCNGNMVAGTRIDRDGADRYMFRVGAPNTKAALAVKGAVPAIMGGKTMGGFIFIPEADCDAAAMACLAGLSLAFNASLPSK